MSALSDANALNKALELQVKLRKILETSADSLKEAYKSAYNAQKEAMGVQKASLEAGQKATESQTKLTEMQTKALEKQNEVVEESKSRFEEWAAKGQESLNKLGAGAGAIGQKIAGVGKTLATGALGALGGGLTSMLKENEAVKASLESVKGSLTTAFQPIMDQVLPLVNSFAGAITSLATTAGPMLANLFGGIDFGGMLAPLLDCANAVLDVFMGMGQSALAWIGGLDLSPLINGFSGLVSAIGPVVDLIMGGLSWAWQNVLQPLGEWAIGDVIPAFFDLLRGALEAINPIVEAFQPLAQMLWDSFLQPLAAWTGGVVVTVIEGIVSGLTTFSEWITENMALVQFIVTLVGTFAAALGLVNAAITIWNVISAIAAAGTTALGTAVAFLTSPVTLTIAAIAALIAVVALLVTHWDTVKTAAAGAWQFIVDCWSNLCAWFAETVIEPIKICGWFTEHVIDPLMNAWNGFKEGFLNLWDGIVNGIRGAINGIIGFVNGLIRAVCGGVNAVIGALNRLSFTVPSWVPEIAAPESHIRSLVAEENKPVVEAILALGRALQSGGVQEFTARQPIEVKLDGQVLYRAMAKIEANRGVRIGGAFANAY